MRRVIYPGTFDPITNGHIDLIERAGRLFDQVVVAVASDTHKTPLFATDRRLTLVRESVAHLPDVQVTAFSGLLVSFVAATGKKVIIRGLRALSDFEFEFQLASMNRRLSPGIETLFLTPAEEYAFLSSSLVREVSRLGGDVAAFVPTPVHAALRERFG